MSYQIIENDVRLLRRILVALQLGYPAAAKAITVYLRDKGLVFVLPDEQKPSDQLRYLSTLYQKEMDLAVSFGCVFLPDYGDVIFLNSEWRNPKTLYVRLVERVDELGELGAVCWTPEKDKYPDLDLFIEAYETRRGQREQPSLLERAKKWLNTGALHRT